MQNVKWLFWLFICFIPQLLLAQKGLQTDLSLSYLVHLPKIASSNPPMLILMHGYGSNETDLFDLKDNLSQNFIIVSLRAPMPMGNNSYQWFGIDMVNGNTQGNRKDIEQSVAQIQSMIPALVKKHHADANSIFLSGFSQGGMMCYELGLRSPEMLKGIAPLSGKIYEELKTKIKISSALKKLHIFIGHGDSDPRVPYSFATAANKYLLALGLKPELHSYKGMQHSINQEEVIDLVKWLNDNWK